VAESEGRRMKLYMAVVWLGIIAGLYALAWLLGVV
jgi:hypothetical protein